MHSTLRIFKTFCTCKTPQEATSGIAAESEEVVEVGIHEKWACGVMLLNVGVCSEDKR